MRKPSINLEKQVLNSKRLAFAAWLAVAVICLGVTPLAKKMALLDGAGSILIAFTTTLISAAFIFAWLVARSQVQKLSSLSLHDWRCVLLVGALGSGVVPLFGIIAMTETSASNRALFQSAYPVATAIAARLMLNERLAFLSYVLIGFVFIGLLLMNIKSGINLNLMNWTFWILLSTLPLIGLTDVIAKRALDNLTPEVIALGRAFGGFLILLMLIPWVVSQTANTTANSWLWIALSGACMGAFSVALYQVFDRTQATLAASLIALAPLLTLAMEFSFLNLALTPVQWIGFALVLIAAMLLARRA